MNLKSFYPFGRTRSLDKLNFGFFSQEERWQYLHLLFPDATVSLKKANCIPSFDDFQNNTFDKIIELKDKQSILSHLSKIIAIDFEILQKSSASNLVQNFDAKMYHEQNIFFGKNVSLRNCTLNAQNGPIIIGDNVEVMEYAVIYGPAIVNSNSKIAPHTFLRSNTVIGKKCFVAGEVKNSLLMSHSNKGHFGYLGDSIVGEFCNLGAGTTTSNLKNNFSDIKIYNPESNTLEATESNKIGTFIGDFSMTAVHTACNAGTTIGVMSNVFGAGECPKHLPDFSWGYLDFYQNSKWQQTARNLMMHKNTEESEICELIGNLDALFNSLQND